MSEALDAVVIGAGPAGANAAIEARKHGLRCLVIDEAAAAGGQIWRAPATYRAAATDEHDDGNRLRAELAASGCALRFGRRVWLVERGFVVHAVSNHGNERYRSRMLIVAAGTSERIVPFEGWTTPGVIGLAAATILLKSQATLPGQRTLVAGRGPLLAAVAAGILKRGGRVAAVVDRNSRGAWRRSLPAMASQPHLLRRGLGWVATLVRNRVPLIHGQAIRRVQSTGDGLSVQISGQSALTACDSLAVGDGLTPACEIGRLLGAEHSYMPRRGGWAPVVDHCGRSTVDGLYFCGDGAGVRGAAAAVHAGRLAGLAAARDAKALSDEVFAGLAASCAAAVARTARFGEAMAALTAPDTQDFSDVPASATVCRCEDVTRGELDEAIGAGAVSTDQLKAWTRCGMGPCQGRFCGETVAGVLAAQTGRERSQVAAWTPRPPLRPVPIAALVGDYGYDDIPIPAAAPL